MIDGHMLLDLDDDLGSKNLINRNLLKKFMQAGVDVICVYLNFGVHDLYGFGDTATFKNGQISLSDHGL